MLEEEAEARNCISRRRSLEILKLWRLCRVMTRSVIFVIGLTDQGKKRSVAEIEMKNTKFEDQLDVMRKILKNLPVVRACMDQTGQGEPLCETLQTEFGTTKVEGILFTSESKEVLAIGVRTGLEKQEFLLQNDPKFHKQIHSIKKQLHLLEGSDMIHNETMMDIPIVFGRGRSPIMPYQSYQSKIPSLIFTNNMQIKKRELKTLQKKLKERQGQEARTPC